ncbi:hypothetical protein KT99_03232 [Shewanella benthica KT99]|uniref:Uncharacterized protein n=1 Tax=Shewanella benthica KT99 TaxID=314608 RepID=A9CYJ3_9GAMM|nr:hypothetical protein KT99_03232 [Shewanella benthica KT99]
MSSLEQKTQAPANGPASDMPPRMAVSRITQEQLSKPFALTHKDVRNVENVWNVFLPTLHQTTFDKHKVFTLLDPRSEHMGVKKPVL